MTEHLPTAPAPDPRAALTADCSRCVALCCVALPFPRSADFPFDKAAGVPCRNLLADHRCGVHDRLRPSGFGGCAVYDCFGAGQVVTQDLFGGRDWRRDPTTAAAMFAVFPVVRQLHEMLWYLAEVSTWPEAAPVQRDASALTDETAAMVRLPVGQLATVDVAAHRARVGPVLRRASLLVRTAGGGAAPKDQAGADLVGSPLAGRDLRRWDLCGAYLIGSDLRGADLGQADLLGADLRGADVRGADLSATLFLTTMQVRAARGDAATRLPAAVDRPAHWSTETRRAPRGRRT